MPSDHSREDQESARARSGVAEFPVLGKLAPVGELRDLYQRAEGPSDGFRLENLLAEMRIGIRVAATDQVRIPASGAGLVVANHPYGVLDGAILPGRATGVSSEL